MSNKRKNRKKKVKQMKKREIKSVRIKFVKKIIKNSYSDIKYTRFM
jgi:hypothetical protein